MKLFLFLLLESLFVCSLQAQKLTGRIVDVNEQPIPNATIFIRETTHGIMADEQGEFQTVIEAGDYTLDISSLGFERKTMKVVVPPDGLALTLQLSEKTVRLREVIVTPGKEDPAYRVMRNVIARAPYHFHQVKSYESDVYFKGNFRMEKMPALIRSQIKEPDLKNMIGKRIVYESQNEIKYTAPDKYDQKVTALSTTFPKSLNIDDSAPLFTMIMNIYSPQIFGGLMGTGSFSVYKFQLDDIYEEGNHQIYKIRIIPRKQNGQLASGHFYVVQDTWTIQQANLNISQAGMTMHLNLVYHEVKPGAFLPSACEGNMEMSIMGVKGDGHFYASIKYKSLETNDINILANVDTTRTIYQDTTAQKPLTKKQERDQQKIEELAGKENLTTREAYKMAQLIEKTVEPDEVKEQKRQLEVRPINSAVVVTRDSLAVLRDSSFWNKTRSLPLRDDELLSYRQYDSLRLVHDSLKSADSLKNRTFGKWMSHVLTGENIKLGEKFFVWYSGLLTACPEYNFVDGFRIGQRISIGVNFDKNRSFSISPAVYYTTARKEIDYVIEGKLTYAPLHNGKFIVSTGNTITDYAGRNGTGRFINTLGSILYAENTAKFYQKRFVAVSNSFDLANGLILTVGVNYEKRNDLENKTSWNLFNKEPNDNRPHGRNERMPDHDAFTGSITLEYTPRYYFLIRNEKKIYLRSDYPTFLLQYNKGFAGNNPANSSFDNIEASFYHTIQLNLFNHLYYAAGVGAFLSAKQTYLPDYKHFRTNEMFLTGKSFNNSFTTDNYRFATNEQWVQGFVTYNSQYLLIKQLPFLQRYLFDEALHLKTRLIPGANYNEAGYSIGFGDMGRIGVFWGFRKMKYDSFGLVLSIPLENN